MGDLLWLIKTFRRAESLLLPLFPGAWRNPPPSYRLVLPLLDTLGRRSDRRKWISPLLYTIRKDVYPPYHQSGLATSEMSPDDLRSMRFVSGLAALVSLVALSPVAPSISVWMKCTLLLGAGALLIYGATRASIDILYASWALLFQPIVFLAVGVQWAGMLLSLCVCVWHLPATKAKGPWRRYEMLSTLPILSSWSLAATSWLSGWPYWADAAVITALYAALWILQFRLEGRTRVSTTIQLVWPSSLTVLVAIGWLHPWLRKTGVAIIYYWPLWLILTLLLSLLLASAAPRLSRCALLFRWPAFPIAFALYGLMIFARKDPSDVERIVNQELRILYQWMWPLWWFAGAGVIYYAHKFSLITLQWLQVFLRRWIMPLGVWGLAGMGYFLGWLSDIWIVLGHAITNGAALIFCAGASLLAWRRKETALGEWLFSGFYIYFFIGVYVSELRKASNPHAAPMGAVAFIGLTVWLLWLNFDLVGQHLRNWKKVASGTSAVAITGCLLWLLLAMVWMTFVDKRFYADAELTLQTNITYDMFVGLTLLAIPLAVYQAAARNSSPEDARMPWGWIILLGIVPVQLLQGLEHYAAAWSEGLSADVLQRSLAQADPSEAGLAALTPSWVLLSKWATPWAIGRWAVAILIATLLIRHLAARRSPRWVQVLTCCFISIAVGMAEKMVISWPAMPYEWAVVLRPWMRTEVIWDLDFLKLYALYGLPGLAWGWVTSKIFSPAATRQQAAQAP